MSNQFDNVVSKIVTQDDRYDRGAYHFVREALEHTIKNLANDRGEVLNAHIDGRELLEGIKDYALRQYGPMTMTLLDQWRVKNCEDFGHIVFNMVDHGIFGKNDNDSIKDFKDGYDFHEAFAKPFMVPGKSPNN